MKFILIETSSSFNHSKDSLFDGATVETVEYAFEKTKMVEVWVKEFSDLESLLRFVVDSNEEAVLRPPGTHNYGPTWVLEIYDSYRE